MFTGPAGNTLYRTTGPALVRYSSCRRRSSSELTFRNPFILSRDGYFSCPSSSWNRVTECPEPEYLMLTISAWLREGNNYLCGSGYPDDSSARQQDRLGRKSKKQEYRGLTKGNNANIK